MSWIISILFPFLPMAALDVARPLHPVECVFSAVLKEKNLPLRADIPLPAIFFASDIPLKQFQDAVEKQWNMRPHLVLNAYVLDLNQIYLLDEAEYYRKSARFIDDSLAHELVHFVQVKYQGYRFEGDDMSLEMEAIAIQTSIRENYLAKGLAPCR
jgi:hypothetical protein